MDLTHRFTVPAPIDEAWAAFNDLERIAPCFPGAALTSYDGTGFAGLVKVKLGPISLQYTGTGQFVERDESVHKAVIEAKGKDKRGNGTAAATITARLLSRDDATTDVEVVTVLNITGKPAQFGRGVMQDVSDKLLGQFATCLETKLGPAGAEPEAPVEPAPAADPEPAPAAAAKRAPTSKTAATKTAATKTAASKSAASRKRAASKTAATETPAGAETPPTAESAPAPDAPVPTPATVTRRDEPETVALNLGTTVLPILLRRYAPYLVGGLVGLVVVWRLLRRLH